MLSCCCSILLSAYQFICYQFPSVLGKFILSLAFTYKCECSKTVYLKVRVLLSLDWLQMVQERIHWWAVVREVINFPKP
jgi:hypothetical protein